MKIVRLNMFILFFTIVVGSMMGNEITKTHNLPQNGDNFTKTRISFVAPGDSGKNVVWDFSQAQVVDGNTKVFYSVIDDSLINATEYGTLMGEGYNVSSQPYRYGGKELVTLGGLNLSDFGARWLDSPSGTFTTMDPLCEDFQHLSPYLYCAGNPIKYIDPSGMYFEKTSMDVAIQILRDLSYELTNIRNNKSISEEETNSRATEIIQSMLDIVFMMYDKTKEYEYSYDNDKNGIKISRKNALGHDVITMYVEKDSKGIKVHESRHGGQVARGELNLGTTSGEFNYNINHEISAYKAQFSVDGVILYNIKYTSNGIDNLFPQKIRTIKDIDEKFIKSIHEEISNGVIVPLYNF